MSNTIVSKGMSTSLIYTETIRKMLLEGYAVILIDPRGDGKIRNTLNRRARRINK